ncbi:MAG: thiamine-phosphate kinase [Candidatus Omnitrophica bacterium]|nr:thiamine-phosphate kinase [Candidatus Omnitrophota bacterium]
MKLSQLGEFGLIDLIRKQLKVDSRVIRGIGDDTAVLPYSKDKYLLLTTDMLAEDIHFTRRMSAVDVGHKALACNISDIAAMGGEPTFAVVSLAVPSDLPTSYVSDLYQGMQKVASQFGVSIVGGDTIKSDKITINVALLGEVKRKHLVTRDGACPGDWIFVTGALGGSLKSHKHLRFTPCVEQARFLVKNFKPSAMMDISDGLAGDLNHILKASGVGAELWNDEIPKTQGCSVRQALSDGEDFELLFTLSEKKVKKLLVWQEKNKQWYFYPIGVITGNKKQLVPGKGYIHF